MAMGTVEVGAPVLLSASGQLAGGTAMTGLADPGNATEKTGLQGCMLGFYVNSTTAGTVVLRNGGSGGTAVTGTITPAIGWNFLPIVCPLGIYATIGGTLSVTFVVVE